MRKVLLVCIMFVLLLAGCNSEQKANFPEQPQDLQLDVKQSYAVGDILILPIPFLENEEYVLGYDIQVLHDDTLLTTLTEDDSAYCFEKAGQYRFIYKVLDRDVYKTDEFSCTVEESSSLEITWLPEKVNCFETLTIRDVYGKVGTEVILAQLTITDPDGNVASFASNQIRLDKEGQWTFSFVLPGDSAVEEVRTVNAQLATTDLFSFTSGGVSKKVAHNPGGMGSKGNPLDETGVLMTFKGDGVIRFNNVIDLTKLDKSQDLIALYAIPNTMPDFTGFTSETLPGEAYPTGGYTHGTTNYTEFYVRLIDKYNPDNVVVVTYYYMPTLSYWNWNEGYIVLGDGADERFALRDGAMSKGINAGAIGAFSFYGEGNNPFNVQLDYSNKLFYSKLRDEQTLVLDYADAEALGAEYVWDGFTTGECYLELAFPSVLTETSILITEIAGISLSEEMVEDLEGPVISVQEDWTVVLPEGAINTAYPIPKATAFDKVSGESDVIIEVRDEKGNRVEQENGFFTPITVGTYTITYTSVDFLGNQTIVTLHAPVLEKIPELKLEFANPSVFEVGNYIYEPEIVITGGSGEVRYTASYRIDDKAVISENGWLFLGDTGIFYADVVVNDFLGEKKISISQELYTDGTPVLQDVQLPAALMRNRIITFPKGNAYMPTTGEQVKVIISVNGTRLGADRSYTPSADSVQVGDVMSVVYTAVANGKSATKSYYIPVVEAKPSSSIQLQGTGSKIELLKRSALLSIQNSTVARFVYPVPADEFMVSFSNINKQSFYEQLTFTLTDSKNIRKSISATIAPIDSNKFYLIVNGIETEVKASLLSVDETPAIQIFYQNGMFLLKNANNQVLAKQSVNYWDDGAEFKGFSSEAVYAQMAFSGVQAETKVELYAFANQTYTEMEVVPNPMIALNNQMQSQILSLNDCVNISSAAGYSTVSGNVTVSYEVFDPNGESVLSANGSVPGQFICDQYGVYEVVYTAYDNTNGKEIFYSYFYDIRDGIAPTVEVEISADAKVGKKITFSKPVISDNLGSDQCSYKVIVINTNGYSEDVTENMYYIPENAGDYRVIFIVIDAAGNMTTVEHDFVAK